MIITEKEAIVSYLKYILIDTTLANFCYSGIFTVTFEQNANVGNITTLEILTNISECKNSQVDDEISNYLQTSKQLYKAFALTVKDVALEVDNSLSFSFDNISWVVISMHPDKYDFVDRSWVIKAERDGKVIEITCNADIELFMSISELS